MAGRPTFKFFPCALPRLSGFAKDTSAATAVEFALILLPFFGLLGATIDAAMLHFQTSQLQLVAEGAARRLMVNQPLRGPSTPAASSQTTLQQFRDDYVCTWQKSGVVAQGTLSKMFDCSQVKLDVITRPGWNRGDFSIADTFVPPPQTTSFPTLTENITVVFKILYPAKSFFGFAMKVNGEANLLMGITAFRVEPAGTNQ